MNRRLSRAAGGGSGNDGEAAFVERGPENDLDAAVLALALDHALHERAEGGAQGLARDPRHQRRGRRRRQQRLAPRRRLLVEQRQGFHDQTDEIGAFAFLAGEFEPTAFQRAGQVLGPAVDETQVRAVRFRCGGGVVAHQFDQALERVRHRDEIVDHPHGCDPRAVRGKRGGLGGRAPVAPAQRQANGGFQRGRAEIGKEQRAAARRRFQVAQVVGDGDAGRARMLGRIEAPVARIGGIVDDDLVRARREFEIFMEGAEADAGVERGQSLAGGEQGAGGRRIVGEQGDVKQRPGVGGNRYVIAGGRRRRE